MTTSDFSLIRGSFELDWEGNISLSLSLTGQIAVPRLSLFWPKEGREGEREASMDVYVQEFNLFFRRNYRAKLFFVASRPFVFRLSLEIPRANLAFFISLSLYLRPRVTKPRRSIRAGNFGKRKKVMRFLKDLIFDPDPSILAPVLPSPTSSVYV